MCVIVICGSVAVGFFDKVCRARMEGGGGTSGNEFKITTYRGLILSSYFRLCLSALFQRTYMHYDTIPCGFLRTDSTRRLRPRAYLRKPIVFVFSLI